MALFPTPQESCFYLDPAAGLDASNNWIDSSPFGLNVTPVGYAAPNYGITTGPSGAKCITFNGANQRGTLPLRFYNNAPVGDFTIACVARHNAPANLDYIFFGHNNAWTRGIGLTVSPTAERMMARSYDAAGAFTTWTDAASVPFTGRTRVSVLSLSPAGSTGRSWHDRVGVAGAFAGSTNPIAYDVAAVPVIGSWSAGAGNFFDGNLYLLAIWPRLFSSQEAVAFSDYWMGQV